MCNATNEVTRAKILRFIDNYTRRHCYCPSIREIAAAVGIKSTATVHGYITRMRREGLIVAEDRCPRTIQIKRKRPQYFTNIRTNTVIRKSM